MPCRTPRISASASQALWITDDILSEAFNCFLRVSHTHRRFGSNIPGPLEARRRIAKRRLGLSAVPSGGAPPVHDLGGLFGLGAARPPEFEKGWKWQAPVPARRVPEADVGARGREEWKMPLFDGSFEQSMETETEDVRTRVEKFLEIPEDPVETSTNAFTKLLEARQDLTTVEAEDLQPFITFLESSSNEPDAELTHRLVQWLTERTTTQEAMDSILPLIRQKLSLQTMNIGEQSDILHTLTQNDHLQAAYRLFIYSQNLSLSDHLDLPLKLIQTASINTNRVWHLFDHRARETSGVPDARNIYPQRLPQDLTSLVQEAAYAWSRSPHLRARVAYRRVWECYRFLAENSIRLTPLMTRALVRAGIANFVHARMAIPRSRVRHILKLVGRIEGQEVRTEVDRLIFNYWLGTRNLSRYKPAGRAWREKWQGEQVLDDGSVRRVRWRGRVLRESVEVRMLRGEQRRKNVMGAGELEVEAEEAVEDAVDQELPVNSSSGVSAETEAHTDVLYPMLGIGGSEDATSIEITTSEITETEPAALDTHPGDSASEVKELPALASEHRGVMQSEESIEGWVTAIEPSDTLDQVPVVSFRPYGATEIDIVRDECSNETGVLNSSVVDAELVAESATYSPVSDADLPLNHSEVAPDGADTEAAIESATYSPLQDITSPLNHREVIPDSTGPDTTSIEAPMTTESESTGLATSITATVPEVVDVSSSPVTNFHGGSYRHLRGQFEGGHQSSADPSFDDTARNAVEFETHVTANQWRLLSSSALNFGFRSVMIQRPTSKPEMMAMAVSESELAEAVAAVIAPVESQRDVYTEMKAKREEEAKRLRERNAKQAKANRKLRSEARKAAAAALEEAAEEQVSTLDEVDEEQISWKSVLLIGKDNAVQHAIPTTTESAEVNAIPASPEHDDRLQLLSTSFLTIGSRERTASPMAPVEEPTGAVDELRSSLSPAKYVHAMPSHSSDGPAQSFEVSRKGRRHWWRREADDEVYSKRLDLRLTKSKIVRLDSQVQPRQEVPSFYEKCERA